MGDDYNDSYFYIAYILFYVVMFQRLIILEANHHSLWIKLVGIFLILLRFSDWPYELVLYIKTNTENPSTLLGNTCWASWQQGILIVNFISDILANLFLSGMFIRRLYKHINSSKASTPQNQMIEYIARKSLICLILTFFVNLIMNLFKITSFLGPYSDAFTVYFELIESTLLVEALRVDENLRATVGCSQCRKSSNGLETKNDKNPPHSQKRSILQFNSFDFVPLEERPSLNESYQHNNNRYSTNGSGNGGRRRYNSNTTSSDFDLANHLQSNNSNHYTNDLEEIIEMNPSALEKHSNHNNEKVNNSNYQHKPTSATTNTLSSHSLSSTSPSTTAIISNQPNPPSPVAQQQHHHQWQQQQNNNGNNNSIRPVETLSSTLVNHPEWNNNDYRSF
ncbi:unnamed protein product [Cunninghamella blakesleeana]